jgi:hypothetical protein
VVINLTGILPDGSKQNPGVTTNPRLAIRVVRGTDVTINVTIITPAGRAQDMSGGGSSSLFSVKRQPSDGAPQLSLVGASQQAGVGNNVIQFTIPNTSWKAILAGLYGYDVQVTIGGKKDVVIPLSPFIVGETEAVV